jgi:hypothetical protein
VTCVLRFRPRLASMRHYELNVVLRSLKFDIMFTVIDLKIFCEP